MSQCWLWTGADCKLGVKAGSLMDMGTWRQRDNETTRRHWGLIGTRNGYIGRKRAEERRGCIRMWEKAKTGKYKDMGHGEDRETAAGRRQLGWEYW